MYEYVVAEENKQEEAPAQEEAEAEAAEAETPKAGEENKQEEAPAQEEAEAEAPSSPKAASPKKKKAAKKPATPSTSTRPTRERKAVKQFSVEHAEKVEIPLCVPEGTGEALGEIENVERRLGMTKSNSASGLLKKLHALVYPGQKNNMKVVKVNLRKFKGIPSADRAAFKTTLQPKLDKFTMPFLKEMAQLLDVATSGSKADHTAAITEFLVHPAASGNEFQKKRGAKGTAKRKRSTKKKVKKKKGPKRPPSSFILYCQDERPKLKVANPGMGVGPLAKLMGVSWNALGEKKKQKYVDKAAKLKAAADAKAGKTKKKSKKKEETESEEEETEEEEDDESSDDDEPLVKKPKVDNLPAMKAKIAELLKVADLTQLTVKKIRKQLVAEFGFDAEEVTEHKAAIKVFTHAELARIQATE
jgi:high mobility group protein B2